ncbi:MAG: D-alanyl-D-alanine carboxypeptidase [Clostridia bacterium]|nr:D-alanyl-D-alanine carboxypeptidase [Clostridia bacterium]
MRNSRKIIRILPALLAVLTLFLSFPIVGAAAPALPPSTDEATAIYFSHLETDKTIVSKSADLQIPAGSTTKVLAGLILCEQLKDRQNEWVTVTSEMTKNSSGQCSPTINEGNTLAVKQLLYAAICASYNDCFDILAHVVAGSNEAFLDRMNIRAKELGAQNTLCKEVSGVNDHSTTTAADLAKIATAASKNELYMQIASTSRYSLDEFGMISNRNALIYSETTTQYYNPKCRGMSAGFTTLAGSCVVTTATNGKESYLCIVMGAENTDTANYGYVIANRLIDWVYRTYTYMDVITADTVLCTIPVTVSDTVSEIEVKTDTTLTSYLPAGLTVGKEITYSIRLSYTSLEAPVEEGFPVGYAAVLYNGELLGSVPLYTAEGAERSSFVGGLMHIQSLTKSRAVRAGVIFFALALIAWITTEYVIKIRKKHKWDKYFSEKMNPPLSLDKRKKK